MGDVMCRWPLRASNILLRHVHWRSRACPVIDPAYFEATRVKLHFKHQARTTNLIKVITPH